MDLDTEGASDVPANHADLRLFQAQMQRRDILHHVRRLCTLIDRQPRFRSIPIGYHRARLQRHASVPSENEFSLYYLVGLGKGLIDSAGIMIALKGEIIAERGMDRGRYRVERGAHVR